MRIILVYYFLMRIILVLCNLLVESFKPMFCLSASYYDGRWWWWFRFSSIAPQNWRTSSVVRLETSPVRSRRTGCSFGMYLRLVTVVHVPPLSGTYPSRTSNHHVWYVRVGGSRKMTRKRRAYWCVFPSQKMVGASERGVKYYVHTTVLIVPSVVAFLIDYLVRIAYSRGSERLRYHTFWVNFKEL